MIASDKIKFKRFFVFSEEKKSNRKSSLFLIRQGTFDFDGFCSAFLEKCQNNTQFHQSIFGIHFSAVSAKCSKVNSLRTTAQNFSQHRYRFIKCMIFVKSRVAYPSLSPFLPALFTSNFGQKCSSHRFMSNFWKKKTIFEEICSHDSNENQKLFCLFQKKISLPINRKQVEHV